LPLAIQVTLDEFVANIAVTLPKIQLHNPGETDMLLSLISLVDELVSDMLSADSSLATQILHQNIDRLVQINSALSYLATQALSGAVPILDRRSLIRRYSLLGVGTAVLALTRIAHSIESAFAEGSIETILEDWGNKLAVLPGLDSLPLYDPSNWRRSSSHVFDRALDVRGICPKLPYFSGRLGFRETEYTISAALQSLAIGLSAEWSFLTVTHEMVHGHVRQLLSIILLGDVNASSDEKWRGIYDSFSIRFNHEKPPDEGLLESLRAVLLTYCCLSAGLGSLTEPTPKPDRAPRGVNRFYAKLLKSDVLRSVLADEFRNISEILVHILDMHYFYRSGVSHYITLIWKSWSKAPQVRADLRQYLLRSLLVIASTKPGTEKERFDSSLEHLRELLTRAKGENGARLPVIEEAVDLLRGDYPRTDLFLPFFASLILVDLAHQFLMSSRIRSAIHAADPHLSPAHDFATNEEWLKYEMADGFVDEDVMSPTAYIADRLTNRINEDAERDTEAETVLMFLACSSRQRGGGVS
jgi:hypothetical protein